VDLAGSGMNDVDPLARIVDEHLIAGDVILTHHGARVAAQTL